MISDGYPLPLETQQRIAAMYRRGDKVECIAYDLNVSIGSVCKYARMFGCVMRRGRRKTFQPPIRKTLKRIAWERRQDLVRKRTGVEL